MNRNLISIKKIASVGICVAILLNLMLVYVSATPNHTATTEFLSEAQSIDSTHNLQAIIQKDTDLFERVGIPEERLSCSHITNDGLLIYELPINDTLTALYTIEENPDGSIEWNIYENDKHDVIVLDSGGNMYLNGNLISHSDQESLAGAGSYQDSLVPFENGAKTVMPRMMNSEYSSTPYGDSDEYTIYSGYRSEDSLNLGQLVKNSTVSSVAASLAEYLLKSYQGAILSYLFFAVAQGLIESAINYDLESEAVSFLVYEYQREGNFILENFYEYIGHYYAEEDHQGTAIIDYYYKWVYYT